MANEYVTMEDACELLSKSEADIKALVADGQLHELRDGDKIYYRRDELKQVAMKEGSSIVDLAAAEELGLDTTSDDAQTESFASALSSLADESSSLGLLSDESPAVEPAESGASDGGEAPTEDADASPLVELSAESFPENLPAAKADDDATDGSPEPLELTSEIDLLSDDEGTAAGISPFGGISPDMGLSPEAAEAEQEVKATTEPAEEDFEPEVPDLGLSGSSVISLEPTLDDTAGPVKQEAKPKGGGISVFEDDELEIDADPMGETQISSSVDELEAVGSGSGLLDLTQESDDTSLGPALLDVISPSEGAEALEAAEEDGIEVIGSEETVEDSEPVLAEAEPILAEAAAARAGTAMAAPRAAAAVVTEGAVPINVCAIVALVAMALVGLVSAGAIQGVWPGILSTDAADLSKGAIHYSVFGGLLAIALGTGLWGSFSGRR
jgi:hypothetical protein